MTIITDEYHNLRTFLFEPTSSPLTSDQAAAWWRETHPGIARLFVMYVDNDLNFEEVDKEENDNA